MKVVVTCVEGQTALTKEVPLVDICQDESKFEVLTRKELSLQKQPLTFWRMFLRYKDLSCIGDSVDEDSIMPRAAADSAELRSYALYEITRILPADKFDPLYKKLNLLLMKKFESMLSTEYPIEDYQIFNELKVLGEELYLTDYLSAVQKLFSKDKSLIFIGKFWRKVSASFLSMQESMFALSHQDRTFWQGFVAYLDLFGVWNGKESMKAQIEQRITSSDDESKRRQTWMHLRNFLSKPRFDDMYQKFNTWVLQKYLTSLQQRHPRVFQGLNSKGKKHLPQVASQVWRLMEEEQYNDFIKTFWRGLNLILKGKKLAMQRTENNVASKRSREGSPHSIEAQLNHSMKRQRAVF
uniref:Uncharacterized protein n=1 Tax=Mucochytrium quahogii TaxID=96639 RepID=A0A7S2W379_9STRA|mmetsp:Transcript_20534/g.33451  ORF Transcript_20534/g.33451 Transcript_20534/m.33451 type:complete len:353 (-) Transcript_20534:35-1093(-)